MIRLIGSARGTQVWIADIRQTCMWVELNFTCFASIVLHFGRFNIWTFSTLEMCWKLGRRWQQLADECEAYHKTSPPAEITWLMLHGFSHIMMTSPVSYLRPLTNSSMIATCFKSVSQSNRESMENVWCISHKCKNGISSKQQKRAYDDRPTARSVW